MKITVNADKVRAELLTSGKHRDGPSRLTVAECESLIALLHGGSLGEVARRTGRTDNNVSRSLSTVRIALNVNGNIELAYLAYERGYVTIEEDQR